MDEVRDPILYDRVLINGTVTAVSLSAGGILQWSEGGSQRRLEVESEVLGFSTEGSRIKIKAVVEGGGGICCMESKGTLHRKTFVFEPLSEVSLRVWCRKLQDYIDSLGRPKKLFVFLNPFGGKKSASNIFIDDVKPLLDDANVEFTMQETKYQLHAKEVSKTLDLSKYDGIICVSGDGVLVEVLNGLLERGDWDTAIRMPLGVVPAALFHKYAVVKLRRTGNGMAKSLLDSVGAPCKASNAMFAIIRGHKCKLDISTIIQGETRFFSALMLAWGLVADIDIESEKYRWMGSARIDFYAFQRIFNLRKYSGSVSFLPAPGFEAFGEPCNQTDTCSPSHKEPSKEQHYGYQGPEVDLETLSWRKITGPFVSVWLHNVPWGGEDTMAAPDAKFSDGFLDLIIIKDCPKLSLLKLMTELNNGGHVKSPHVLYLKVKAFILEPGPQTADQNKEGIIDVDGEVLARGRGTYKYEQKTLMNYDKLQITVDQGLATLFSPI